MKIKAHAAVLRKLLKICEDRQGSKRELRKGTMGQMLQGRGLGAGAIRASEKVTRSRDPKNKNALLQLSKIFTKIACSIRDKNWHFR